MFVSKGPIENKGLFKNLRMRLKLVNNQIEKPEKVEDKFQKHFRLRKFLDFFKFRGLKKMRKSRKITPAPVKFVSLNVSSVEVDASVVAVQGLGTEKKAEDTDGKKSDVGDDKALIDNKGLVKENELSLVVANGGAQKENASSDLFERIEKKIASSKPKTRGRLAPIAGVKKMPNQLQVEYSLFGSNFYRGDLNSPEAREQPPARPTTPRLCRDPLESRQQLSKEALIQKQSKADEIRNDTVVKRLQAISARRDRFEKRKDEFAVELAEKKKKQIESKIERGDKVAENKTRVDTGKVEVSTS